MIAEMNSKPRRFSNCFVYLIFFISGAAGLIYEISWTRQIGLLFGHTIHAASIVLASFFAGMAIGYLIGAKVSSRISPLVGYGIAEVLIAIWTFAIPAILRISESNQFSPLLSSTSPIWQTTARAVFCFFLLLPATTGLGFTFPMIASFLSGRETRGFSVKPIASRIALAYSINTVGAMVGVTTVTFFMIATVGVRSSSYVAANMSIVSALMAFWVVFKTKQSSFKSEELGTKTKKEIARAPWKSSYILAIVSGFGILALQVLYTRMFSLVFHNSIYTFGIVVAVFLGSLALGTALVSKFHAKYSTRFLIGLASGVGALATVCSPVAFVLFTGLKYFSFGDSFFQYMTAATMLVAFIIAPAISTLGMILPLVWINSGQLGHSGKIVGRLTAANTLAAAVGALAASFLLLVCVGLWGSIVLVASMFFAVAFWLLKEAKHVKLLSTITLVFGVAVALALRSPVDSVASRMNYHEQVIRRWNSPYGWIDLVQNVESGSYKIRQNLHYRFGKTGSNSREMRQSHIPLLLHKKPKDVLFMGLGTGLTAGGAIPNDEVESIVAVELIPEVVLAVRELAEYNNGIVDHPKTKVIVDDARHYLIANDKKYDVIVSDLFVPWESETGYLYTVEHYELSLSRLKKDGLFCQWLPVYQLGQGEFELIANSFASVFPNTTIWWGQLEKTSPVVALIGSKSKIRIDESRLLERQKELFRNVKFDHSISTPQLLLDHYIGDWTQDVDSLLNTDEHPRVEFSTPISNRNRDMIRGENLERYFLSVLSKLPSSNILPHGTNRKRFDLRLKRQKFILFGR